MTNTQRENSLEKHSEGESEKSSLCPVNANGQDLIQQKPQKPHLSPPEKRLIFCLCMFGGVLAFGTYLIGKWTLDSNGGRLDELVYQIVMQIIPGILGYLFVIKLCDRVSMSIFLAIIFSVMAGAHTIFIVLAINQNTVLANILFGIVFGLSRGAFWGCCNNLHVSFVNRGMRGRYYGILGIWNQSIHIVAPLIMLILVVTMGGNYQMPLSVFIAFFVILVCCCLLASIAALRMKIPKYKHRFSLRQLFKSNKNVRWSRFMAINFMYGAACFPETIVSSIYILAFAVFQNYFYLLMLVISYALSIVTNYFFAKPFFARHRVIIYYLCLLVTSAINLCLVLFYDVEFGHLVALGVLMLSAVFKIARDQCDNVMHNSVVAQFEFEDSKLSGAFFLRELAIGAGKVAASVVLIVASLLGEKNSLIVGMLVAYILPSIFMFVICRKNFEDGLI